LRDTASHAIVTHDTNANRGTVQKRRTCRPRRSIMGIIKLIGALLGLLIAAAVIVPLVVLAGLFVWLKLTEEADEEALELEQEAGI
jgi:fatty acid desaturase